MISRCLVALVLLVLLFNTPAMAVEKVFPYPYETHTQANGLTVITIPMPTPGLVAYFTVVRTGSRDEVEPGRSGFAHFFEHMMFRGTKKYPGSERERIVTSLGARANASTTDDFTMYYLSFAKDDLEKVIEIESDRFQNLDYTKPAFQTEAGAILGEYRIGAAQPWFALHEKIQDLAYDKHTYKHTTIGFEADVKTMPEAYEYSLDFYHRFYRPENVVLVITGDINPAATLHLVEKYYGSWKKGYQAPKITPEPPQTAPRSAEITFPGRTLPILVVAYKGDAFDPSNRDYVAARLLGELAFGPQSELYKKLVLREQKVEMLQCDIAMNRDQPLFDIAAVVKNVADVDAVRDDIYRTLDEFKTKPVDQQKLDDLKRRDRYEFVMELDTPDKVASHLARFIAISGGIGVVERLYAESEKVTPQDIMHAAAKYFVPDRRTVVLLKEKGAEAEAKGEEKEEAEQKPETKPLAVSPESQPASALANSPNPESKISNPQSPIPNPPSPPVLLPIADDPTISFRLWFQAGSQNDPPGKEGLAAITASLIAEGATRSNSYEQILDKLFPLAASYAESTGVEMAVIFGRVHKDNLDRFYPLLIEAICVPAFKQDDLDRIKSQTINYLENTLRYSSDEELGKAVLYDTVFAGTPYGHLPAGTIDSVSSITADDVKEFYRTYYTRDNVVIGLGGGFEAATLQKLQQDMDSLPAGLSAAPTVPSSLLKNGTGSERAGANAAQDGGSEVPVPLFQQAVKPAPIHGRQATIIEKDCGATAISMGFPIDVLRGSKDWYALAVANAWLGQHRNSASHLYQVIREARGLNYGDYTYIEHFPGGSRLLVPPTNVCRRQQIFEMWIRPVPHAARQFALRAALRELKNLVDNGMTEKDFNAARNFLRKYVIHLAPTTMDRLGYALDDRFYGIQGSHLEDFARKMDALTLADVNAAVKKHLQYENMDIIMVTKDAQSLKEALTNDAPSPITYPTPKPDSVLAEDREISVFPLKIKSDDVQVVPVTELFIK